MDEVAFGRYRLLELIGEGGMGQVFKAYDTVIGRDVAIKVLPAEMGTLDGYRQRFRREAQVAARLTEPHIIPIHDTGEIDGRLYLVMPVIEGIDVQTLLEHHGPMAPARAVRVIQQLAAALNMAHRNGLVHRDIKPSNALVTADEHVYLIDFGIAHDSSATRMTQTGTMVGTFSYMAPERFLAGNVDARADVYSLACVLHECLTGARPFTGDSMEQQIAGHLTMAPPRPSGFNPALAGFDEVVARGMAKQPNERYQTAAELAAAAHDALSGAHTPPPPPVPPQRQPPRPWLPGPTDPTMVANQQATLHRPMPLVGAAPEAPALSTGRFGSLLAGVVLVSLLTASLAVPTRLTSLGFGQFKFASAVTWLVILGMIPGIVLLARGRGRARVDMTFGGCALIGASLGTLSALYFLHALPVDIRMLIDIAGLLLVLIPAFPHPTRALARGLLLFGWGISAVVIIDLVAMPFRFVAIDSVSVALGAAVCAIVLSGGAIAWRQAAADSAAPTIGPTLSVARFACVLGGTVLLAISVAGLLVPWCCTSMALNITSHLLPFSRGAPAFVWSAIIAAVPGIVLLLIGRGRARVDQTIAGCALAALSLGTLLLRLIHTYVPPGLLAALAVVGLLAFLIPISARPTPAAARGIIVCGVGILTLNVVGLGYALDRATDVPIGYLLIAGLVGVIAFIAGLVARRAAGRNVTPGP